MALPLLMAGLPLQSCSPRSPPPGRERGPSRCSFGGDSHVSLDRGLVFPSHLGGGVSLKEGPRLGNRLNTEELPEDGSQVSLISLGRVWQDEEGRALAPPLPPGSPRSLTKMSKKEVLKL